MFNPCTLDTRGREEEHQKMDCCVQSLYIGYKGEGGRSIRRWTVMFDPCTLDTRRYGGRASEDGLLCLTLVHWKQEGGVGASGDRLLCLILVHLIQGGGGRSIRRWTVMFNPCTLDTRRGEEELQRLDCFV